MDVWAVKQLPRPAFVAGGDEESNAAGVLANFYREQEDPVPTPPAVQANPWLAVPFANEDVVCNPFANYFAEQEDLTPNPPAVQNVPWLPLPFKDDEIAGQPFANFFREQEDPVPFPPAVQAVPWTPRPALDDEIGGRPFANQYAEQEDLPPTPQMYVPWLAVPFGDEDIHSTVLNVEDEAGWAALQQQSVETLSWLPRPTLDEEAITTAVSPAHQCGGTTVDDATVGQIAWANPGNVSGPPDGSVATAALTLANPDSHYLKTTAFGFNIPPTATITGFVVTATVKESTSLAVIQDTQVRLVKAGTIGSTNRSNGQTFPTTLGDLSWGSSTDTFGDAWQPADVNAANFGVAFACSDTGGLSLGTASVDAICLTIYFTINVVGDDGDPLTTLAVITDSRVVQVFWSDEIGTGLQNPVEQEEMFSLVFAQVAQRPVWAVLQPSSDDEAFVRTGGLEDEQPWWTPLTQNTPWLPRPALDEHDGPVTHLFNFFAEQEDWLVVPPVQALPWLSRPGLDDEFSTNLASFSLEQEEPFLPRVTALPWLAVTSTEEDPWVQGTATTDDEAPFSVLVQSAPWLPRPFSDDETGARLLMFSLENEEFLPGFLKLFPSSQGPWLPLPFLDDETTGVLFYYWLDHQDGWYFSLPFPSTVGYTITWLPRPHLDDEIDFFPTLGIVDEDHWRTIPQVTAMPWLAAPPRDEESPAAFPSRFDQEEFQLSSLVQVPWVARPYLDDETSAGLKFYASDQEDLPRFPIVSYQWCSWVVLSDEIGQGLSALSLDDLSPPASMPFPATSRFAPWVASPFTDEDPWPPLALDDEVPWALPVQSVSWLARPFSDDEAAAGLKAFALEQEEFFLPGVVSGPWLPKPFLDEADVMFPSASYPTLLTDVYAPTTVLKGKAAGALTLIDVYGPTTSVKSKQTGGSTGP